MLYKRTKTFNYLSVSPEQPTRMRPPFHRFLLYRAFSIRLPGRFESRLRGATTCEARHRTFGQECSHVRRNHFSLHIDNYNSGSTRSTHATSRLRYDPSSTTLWQLTTTTTRSSMRYSVATPATYTPIHKPSRSTWAVQVPLPVKNRRGQPTRANAPTNKFLLDHSKREPVRGFSSSRHCCSDHPSSLFQSILYAMFKDEDLHTTMRIPAPHAIEGYAPGILGRCRGLISTAEIRRCS